MTDMGASVAAHHRSARMRSTRPARRARMARKGLRREGARMARRGQLRRRSEGAGSMMPAQGWMLGMVLMVNRIGGSIGSLHIGCAGDAAVPGTCSR